MAQRDSCESIEAVLAFLDESLEETTGVQSPYVALPTLTDGEWDPSLKLDAVGDFYDPNVIASNPLCPPIPTAPATSSARLQLETIIFDVETADSDLVTRNSKKTEKREAAAWE
ncbi:unnamed protein product [Phytophthora lilii]|uniref:Unnamed protein product n=1 Tax=Phytophthora lilii TaxID=2077276 RepID=A0A9W6TQ50_9STRA|nr:unnamed protein product [Phytophthora lilii]